MKAVTVEVVVHKKAEEVWKAWSTPEDITGWAFASDDWECPYAQNDLTVGGKFLTRMAAKDGSAAFDFTGSYTEVVPYEQISYRMDDGRVVSTSFEKVGDDATKVLETFEMENENPEEMQRAGWQAILGNFKKYVERE